MEERALQPETDPDSIHTILSRFTSWAGKQSPSDEKTLDDHGVREVSCEEVMRSLRTRRSTRTTPAAKAADLRTYPDATPTPAPVNIPLAAAELAAQPLSRPPRTPAAPRPRTARCMPRKAQSQEFRQVLAKTVQQKPSAAAMSGKSERSQRVSLRLSPAEEQLLQQSAALAGITVSEYLRRRALEAGPLPGELRPVPLATSTATAAPEAETAAASQKTGFGDWITLLRNRFLSSPARFAERA
jgi:hypothetical protein